MCDFPNCRGKPEFKIKIKYGDKDEKLRVCKQCTIKNYGEAILNYPQVEVVVSKLGR